MMEAHMKLHDGTATKSTAADSNEMSTIKEPPPVLCSNENCSKFLTDPNSLNLCQACLGKLGGGPTECASWDGTNWLKALLSAYFKQLDVGCRRPGCNNKHCVTACGGGDRPKNVKAAAALRLAKLALA